MRLSISVDIDVHVAVFTGSSTAVVDHARMRMMDDNSNHVKLPIVGCYERSVSVSKLAVCSGIVLLKARAQ